MPKCLLRMKKDLFFCNNHYFEQSESYVQQQSSKYFKTPQMKRTKDGLSHFCRTEDCRQNIVC